MDNNMNYDIIEKAICKRVAIYKAIDMLPPIETKDLWEENKYTNQNQNNLKLEEKDSCVTMNETKNNSMKNDWRDITDPKLRRKMRVKAWHDANKDKIKCYSNKWLKANKDKIKEYKKSYRDKNNKRHAERKKTDVQYNLSRLLRDRLNKAIRGNQKSGSAINDLGCTIQELKQYLESKFQTGMTWDNHGQYGWHIDHIKPLASFDLSDRKQLLEACHYTNLQPLWATDNLAKSDKIL